MVSEKKPEQTPPPPDEDVHPKFLWHSGKLVEWETATVHVTTLGWSAISSVFEGIRAYWSPGLRELFVFHLDTHLSRLFQSMKIMRMLSLYSKDELAEAVLSLLKANEFQCDTYIQPLSYFGGGVPGYLAVLEQPGEVVVTARPAPSNLGTLTVAHCNVSSWTRISDNVMPPRVKAIANYQNSRYVSTESRINGYDFGIILNQDGKVAEASYACLYIVRDGVAITPRLPPAYWKVSHGMLPKRCWSRNSMYRWWSGTWTEQSFILPTKLLFAGLDWRSAP